jgi:hypothetical protein
MREYRQSPYPLTLGRYAFIGSKPVEVDNGTQVNSSKITLWAGVIALSYNVLRYHHIWAKYPVRKFRQESHKPTLGLCVFIDGFAKPLRVYI